MIAPESMKYLGINLKKYVHYLYATNDKALMNEIKGVNKRREIPCSWISVVPTKIPAYFFVDIDKLKCMWKGKGIRIAKMVFKKNKVGGFMVPDLKLLYSHYS